MRKTKVWKFCSIGLTAFVMLFLLLNKSNLTESFSEVSNKKFIKVVGNHNSGKKCPAPHEPQHLPELFLAIDNEDPIKVAELIKSGADPNLVFCESVTALVFASGYRENLKVIKVLVENGAHVNTKTYNGSTPLAQVAYIGANNIVKFLLENNAFVDTQDFRGNTPLHLASSNRQMETMKILISFGANVNLKNSKNDSPLHNVARFNEVELFVLLVNAGSVINPINQKGQTPLHIAVIEQNGAVVKYLLDHGANINIEDYIGKTPLDYSLELGNKKITNLFKLKRKNKGL